MGKTGERRAAAAQALAQELIQAYPVLAAMPPGWQADLVDLAVLAVPAGTALFTEHSPCQGFPLVLSGEVRVARCARDGRSLELYRVTAGEVCIVSASCVLGAQRAADDLPAHGHAAQACRLLLLPPEVFLRWCGVEAFRGFVFGVFASRLGDLIELAEAVAFQPLEQRLAAALLGRGSTLRLTHARLAEELGTAREIVTRLLKRYEQAGWVRLGRERIELLDATALRQCAAGDATD
jgi:CRP/FNR family transcriptional regulator, anaerobic regulatory protein